MTPDTARSQGFRLCQSGTLVRDDGPSFEECITRLHTVDQEGQVLASISVLATTRDRAKTMATHWSQTFQIPATFAGKDAPTKPGKVSVSP